jgi:hypothetical protein
MNYKTKYQRQKEQSRRERIVVMAILFLLFAYLVGFGSICTGHFEGEKGASCVRIINIIK